MHADPPLSELTPLILAWNEEANLARCLDAVAWASQIVLVDSGSTDRTLEIAAKYPQVRVVYRAFDDHARQANFGLGQVTTSWVLSMDADYVLTPEFQRALRERAFAWEKDCVYFAPFIWCVEGHPLRACNYPPRGVLYAREGARYEQDGHAHRLALAGRRRVPLPYRIYHDDRKPVSRWLQSQATYARMEAAKLAAAEPAALPLQDKLRHTGWAAALVIVPYTLLGRGLILDGWPGLTYAMQRGYAEILLALFVLERRVRALPAAK